jgi:hypothetical protein
VVWQGMTSTTEPCTCPHATRIDIIAPDLLSSYFYFINCSSIVQDMSGTKSQFDPSTDPAASIAQAEREINAPSAIAGTGAQSDSGGL